jgi:hypothetical protein
MKRTEDHDPNRLSKIQSLAMIGSTAGERSAAEAALDRVKSKLPVRISATVLDIDRSESFYEVSYADCDGGQRTTLLGRELFRTPLRVVDRLMKAHADLPHHSAECVKLVETALQLQSGRKYSITGRCGWSENWSFVQPTATYGKLNGQLIYRRQDVIDPALGQQSGSLRQWQDGLRGPCECSDYLILANSITGASALIGLLTDREPAVFHLHGSNRNKKSRRGEKTRSSSGKTLAARCGASVIGRCEKSDLITFAASIRALEEYCFAHRHLGAFLDEAGRALTVRSGPRVKPDELPYIVTSGRGAVRSTAAFRGTDLPNLTWSEFALTTGEDSLDHGHTTGRPEGAEVRMIGLPVPSGRRGGIFNRLKGSKSAKSSKAKKLARQVETTITANYGFAGPAFFQKLAANRVQASVLAQKLIDAFVIDMGADADPWERRFAEKFGVILAAAILMARFGVAPWNEQRARAAITSLYKKARAASASMDEAAQGLVQHLQRLLQRGKRFPKLFKGEQLPENLTVRPWGVQRRVAGVGMALLVRLPKIEKLVNPRALTPGVLAKLEGDGIVRGGSDGKRTRQVMIDGLFGSKRRRFVCFKLKSLRNA